MWGLRLGEEKARLGKVSALAILCVFASGFLGLPHKLLYGFTRVKAWRRLVLRKKKNMNLPPRNEPRRLLPFLRLSKLDIDLQKICDPPILQCQFDETCLCATGTFVTFGPEPSAV